MAIAQASWDAEAKWSKLWDNVEIKAADLPRVHPDCSLPFVKDLIDQAANRCLREDDVLALSNSDVGVIFGITTYVLDSVRKHGCSFTHRYDRIGACIDSPIRSEADVRDLKFYPGSDFLFMAKSWWDAHRGEMPDMVIGREYWDCVLRQLMKKTGSTCIPHAVWHERHASDWAVPSNRATLPGNVYNRDLATRWFSSNHSDQNDPYRSTWNVVPGVTVPVNPETGSPTDRTEHRIIWPRRFEFHQNPARRVITG